MERLLSYMLTFWYWILTRIDVHPQFIRQVLSQGSHQNSNLLFLLPVLILTIFLILKLNRNSDMSYLFWLRFVLLCFKRMKHTDFYPSWYTTLQSLKVQRLIPLWLMLSHNILFSFSPFFKMCLGAKLSRSHVYLPWPILLQSWIIE